MKRPRSVELHIGRLVLEGFSPADRHRIGAAVERELSRLLSERGLPASLMNRPMEEVNLHSLDGGGFQGSVSGAPRSVGIRVAERIYRGLAGGERRQP